VFFNSDISYPAPNFIAEEHFMKIILYSPKKLEKMDKDNKIRACYQHCCLTTGLREVRF